MTNLGRAGLAGAVIVLGAFVWKYGLSFEDLVEPVVWMVLTGIAVLGAILGVAGELAWQNVRESRMWMVWTALCLAALSGLIVVPFMQEARETTAFFATADSTRGVVESKIYRGGPRLRVTYSIAGQQRRLVTPGGDPRYDRWTRGDSVWVHFQAITPDSARVGRFGPRAAPMLRSLSWLWGVGGLLLLGYLPPVVALLKREWRDAEAKRITAPVGPES